MGNCVSDDKSLKDFGIRYFRSLFEDEHLTNLEDQLKIIRLFLSFINPEKIEAFTNLVTILEVEKALNLFKKDKVPGPDGWPVEFYLTFFDILGPILVKVVEASRISGRVSHDLNSTFLTLIPKVDMHVSFTYFHPISLCNLCYKIISKVAAMILKPFLDDFISPQQFGFFLNRQILEPIAISQEVLHTVNSRKRCALILKLDLSKAFDRVNWTFIRLILIQIGIPLVGVN